MKKILMIVAGGLLAFNSFSQSTNITDITNGAKGSTNWVAIPYGKYDLTSKQFGYGAAVMYKQGDSLWTGIRIDRIDGEKTTAGVQAQLKTDMTFAGITIHPFAETSVGIGQSSMYGSAGAGGYVMLLSHDWTRNGKPPVTLDIGLIADYEHVVFVGSAELDNNQINAGPLIHLSF